MVLDTRMERVMSGQRREAGRREHVLRVVNLGVLRYGEALGLQRAAAAARIDGSLPDDTLLLVQHPPVVTLGRSNQGGTLLADRDTLAREGVDLFEVERGGEATFHGPGQLVGYPIMHLEHHRPDLHWYLRHLEGALIDALARMGLPSVQNPGMTGVWTQGVGQASFGPRSGFQHALEADAGALPGSPGRPRLRKIASIGVHARSWVTWHGFALNVSTALRCFDLIVPCGIDGVEMTSLVRELGRDIPMDLVADEVTRSMAGAFGLTAETWPPDSLPPAEAVHAAG
jgi:lipoate-protein ligase B